MRAGWALARTERRSEEMKDFSKLGTDRSITGLLPALFTLVLLGVAHLLFGMEIARLWAFVLFAMFAGLAWIAFARTRSKAYLASALYLCSVTVVFGAGAGQIPIARDKLPALALLVVVTLVWALFLVLTKQAKWRGRDILELAAQPVESTSDGFTSRPKPAGKAELSRDDVLAFAGFARRNLIAMPYVEPRRVVFVPVKMGAEFGHLFAPRRDYSRDTWVAFADDGDVSVNISEQDYRAYRDELAFDRLCESLARVFTEFVELYRGGKAARVIDRLDAMRVGVFS